MTKGSTIALALVGCGGIAQAHWQGMQRVGSRARVTAVVDPVDAQRDRMAEQTGARAFASIEAALAEGGFDAVDIMLPHDLHEAAALACLQAGKHVMLEKPLAHTLDSAERILAAARAIPDRVFMVAEQAQYWADVIKARALIDAGAIGDVVNARACFFDPVRIATGAVLPWRYQLERAGGGLTIDGGAHWIRPLRMMLGEVEEAIGVTGNHLPMMQGETWSQAILRFESGVTAVFDALYFASPVAPVDWFRVSGTEGELVISGGTEATLKLYNRDHPAGTVVMEAWSCKLDSFGLEIDDFAGAVLNGETPAASAEYALGELRTALAIYRSAATGQWQKVWE